MAAIPRVACPVRGDRRKPLYDDANASHACIDIRIGPGCAAGNRPAQYPAFVVLIAEPVKARTIAVVAS
ncbi:hypothetical protein [Burkholderia sp. BE17]|uniref:hypothetical protein n=1 Tax=Burkholderia sp. BE17 TaxID=2656644 RepID=UPI00128D2C32|nr:hypothetical protein [Burkholderia sp. BE17]MPV67410.1 hypothetical protein [Burkholderia sp. BE17]